MIAAQGRQDPKRAARAEPMRRASSLAAVKADQGFMSRGLIDRAWRALSYMLLRQSSRYLHVN